jgi:hypothetical protein
MSDAIIVALITVILGPTFLGIVRFVAGKWEQKSTSQQGLIDRLETEADSLANKLSAKTEEAARYEVERLFLRESLEYCRQELTHYRDGYYSDKRGPGGRQE